MSASLIETTTNSRPVSQHQIISELPETEDTSEEVNGHLVKYVRRHTMNLAEVKPSLSNLHRNIFAPQSVRTDISRAVSQHLGFSKDDEVNGQASNQLQEGVNKLVQAQSSKHNQEDKDATLVEIPSTDEEQDESYTGSSPNLTSSSQKILSSRSHSVDMPKTKTLHTPEYESERRMKIMRKAIAAFRRKRTRYQNLVMTLKPPSLSTIASSENESEHGETSRNGAIEAVPAEMDSGQNLEEETPPGDQSLNDAQLDITTETSVPSVDHQVVTDVSLTGTTPDELNPEDNRMVVDSEQSVIGENLSGDQSFSDTQLDVGAETSMPSIRKKTSGTRQYQSDCQGSNEPPRSSGQSKEDIFGHMIASALKEVEIEQNSAEQKRHPTTHERCKKTILFPEVVVADRQKGILGFKMHKYVLEQDRTVPRQPKANSGSAKTEPQPRSTCKYVRKAESSLESKDSSETIPCTLGAANAQNADPQAPNKQDAQQDDEGDKMLPKKSPQKGPPES
ncbi:uncharacterized protein LOC144596250 [Rhinoraja longicauda]